MGTQSGAPSKTTSSVGRVATYSTGGPSARVGIFLVVSSATPTMRSTTFCPASCLASSSPPLGPFFETVQGPARDDDCIQPSQTWM
jgi:hypothetical protein